MLQALLLVRNSRNCSAFMDRGKWNDTEKQEEKMRKKVLHLLLFVLILAGVYYYEIDNSVSVSAATDTYVARDPFYSLTDSSVNRMSSEHFQIIWGNKDTTGTVNKEFVRGNLENLETIRSFYMDKLKFADLGISQNKGVTGKYKTNVYIAATGLSKINDDWAYMTIDKNAFAYLVMAPGAMRVDPPSWVVPHELAHAFTYHMGGVVPYEWYEAVANFCRNEYLQSSYNKYGNKVYGPETDFFAPFLLNAESHFPHTKNWYDVWPIFLYIEENPDQISGLGHDAILKILKNNKEDTTFFHTIERVTGVEIEKILGGFERRLVTMDFKSQSRYQKSLKDLLNQDSSNYGKIYTTLNKSSDGWMTVPDSKAPQQGGYNIVPLDVDLKKDLIEVEFKGLSSASGAGWRISLVTETKAGKTRYSDMWNGGTNSMELKGDETKAYLVVSATPSTMKKLALDKDGTKYPYKVKVTAKEAIQKVELPKEYDYVLVDEKFDGSKLPENFVFPKEAEVSNGRLVLTKNSGNGVSTAAEFAPEVAKQTAVDFSFEYQCEKGNKMGLQFRDPYGRLVWALCAAPEKSELWGATVGVAVDDAKAAANSTELEPKWEAVPLDVNKVYTIRVRADFNKKTVSYIIAEKSTGKILAQKVNAATEATGLARIVSCSWWDSKTQYLDNFRLTAPVKKPDLLLKDKSVYVFGDSIILGNTYPRGGFADLAAKREGMKLQKFALGGSTILDANYPDGQILSQIQSAPAAEPDYILFDGGTHDAEYMKNTQGVPYGTVTAEKDPDALDTSTFAGAFEKTVCTMKQKWPKAQLVYVAVHKLGSRDKDVQEKLHELELQICRKWDVTVADLYKKSSLDTNDTTQKNTYTFNNTGTNGLPGTNGTGTHPNLAAIEKFYVPMVVSALLDLPEEYEHVLVDEKFDGSKLPENFAFPKEAEVSGGCLVLTKNSGNGASAAAEFAPEVTKQTAVDFSFEYQCEKANKMGLQFRDAYGRLVWALCVAPEKSELRGSTVGVAVDDAKAAAGSADLEPKWEAVTLDVNKTYVIRVRADFEAKTVSYRINEKATGKVLAQKVNAATEASGLARIISCSWWDSKAQYLDNFRLTAPVKKEALPLKDKSVYVFGDSIILGNTYSKGGFADLAAKSEGMKLQKFALGGSTILDANYPDGQILSQIQSAPAAEPDYILFDGGAHDAEYIANTQGVPYGTVTAEKDPDALDTSTFAGAFEKTVCTMKQKWPKAQLVYVAVHKMGSRDKDVQEKLYELELQICRKWDVTVADLYKKSSLDTNDTTQKNTYTFNSVGTNGLPGTNGTGTHPNLAAIEKFYVPAVVSALLELPEEYEHVFIDEKFDGSKLPENFAFPKGAEVSGGRLVLTKNLGNEVSAAVEFAPEIAKQKAVDFSFEYQCEKANKMGLQFRDADGRLVWALCAAPGKSELRGATVGVAVDDTKAAVNSAELEPKWEAVPLDVNKVYAIRVRADFEAKTVSYQIAEKATGKVLAQKVNAATEASGLGKMISCSWWDSKAQYLDNFRLTAPEESVGGTTYYVSAEGNDSFSGKSPEKPWKSLDKVNSVTFRPGDQILFECGDTWAGKTLHPLGSGEEGNPIVIGSYVDTKNENSTVMPKIAANGKVEDAVYFHNQEYWEITGLDISNTVEGFTQLSGNGTGDGTAPSGNNADRNDADGSKLGDYRGIHIVGWNTGSTLKGFWIHDLRIHDVTGIVSWIGDTYLKDAGIGNNYGLDKAKRTGGILIECYPAESGETYKAGETKATQFSDIKIEHNQLINNSFGGITVKQYNGSGNQYGTNPGWANRNGASVDNGYQDANWKPHKNIVIQDNYINQGASAYACNGIYLTSSQDSLIQRNVLEHLGTVGIELYFTDNVVVQYNEVSDVILKSGGGDATGIDPDWRVTNALIQYNYIHDCGEGFLLCGMDYNTGIIRYNLLQDMDRAYLRYFVKSGYFQIYNNNFYRSKTGQGTNKFDWWSLGSGTGIYMNNIMYDGKGEGFTFDSQSHFSYDNNAYYGTQAPAKDENALLLTESPFEGQAPDMKRKGDFTTGPLLEANGLKLKADSLLAGMGTVKDIYENLGLDRALEGESKWFDFSSLKKVNQESWENAVKIERTDYPQFGEEGTTTQNTASKTLPSIGMFERTVPEGTVILRGKVKDELNPAVGVTVRVQSGGKTLEAVTDSAGNYRISEGLVQGEAVISVEGYDIAETITLNSGIINRGNLTIPLMDLPEEYEYVLMDEKFDGSKLPENFVFPKGAEVSGGRLVLTKNSGNGVSAAAEFAPEVAKQTAVDFSFEYQCEKADKMGLQFRDAYGRLVWALCAAPGKNELRGATVGVAVDDAKAAANSTELEPKWEAVTLDVNKAYVIRVRADFEAKTVSYRITEKGTGKVLAQKVNAATEASGLDKIISCSWWDSKAQYLDNFRLTAPVEKPDLPLKDKSVYVFGDSIILGNTYPKGGFADLTAKREGMKLQKFALGGSTIMDANYPDGQILSQIQSAPAAEPDYILFDGGAHDAEYITNTQGVSYGTVTAEKDPDALDTSTFAGAFEKTICTMKQKWPKAQLVYVAVHKMGSRDKDVQEKLHELEIRICRKWGVKVGDLYEESSLDTNDTTQKNTYTFNSVGTNGLPGTNGTGTHPNLAAIEAFYEPVVAAALRRAQEIPEVLAEFDFDADGQYFDGGNAKAEGTYTLESHGSGKALKLDGNGQYLAVTAKDGKSLLTDVDEMTVSYQIRPENSKTNWGFFAAPNADTQKYQQEHYLGIVDINGTTSAERYNNSGARPATAKYATGYNGWYYVTVVYTEGATTLYINGEKAAEEASAYALTEILGDNSILYIGKSSWGQGEYATALIDNYKIVSRALTADEVKAEAAKYVENEPAEADKEALKAAIDAKVDGEDTYTAESWNAYKEALTAANTVYNKKEAAQEEVDAAEKALTDAWTALKKKERPFADVDRETGSWYYDAVYDNFDKGIIQGVDPTHFEPLSSLTRAQFAIILHRMEKQPASEYSAKFADVEAGVWYTDAIMWASANGIVTGYADGSRRFGTGDKIVREQMAVMLYRYAKDYKKYDVSKAADFAHFTDAASVSAYAEEAVAWAVGNGILTGKDNGTKLDPQGDASRAECAVIIQRFLEKYGE